MKYFFTLLTALVCSVSLSAQTFNEVTAILQTNCSSSYCHGAGTAGLTITEDATPGELYDILVAASASNEWAAERNMPLVDPGQPDNSFLYRKLNNGLHHDSTLPLEAGGNMPPNQPLASQDIELVRQWILYGAKEFGTVIDSDILAEYYDGNGLDPIEKPDAPPEGEGFQLYFGKIFLEPEEEKEIVYKRTIDNDEIEINKIEVVMDSNFSHHFLFFQSPDDINQAEGIVDVGFFGGGQAITSDNKMVGGWAYSKALDLPAGTAYSWEENSTLKFNYHIKNYSTTSVLPAEVYINVYTQEPGTAIKEMHSDFFINANFGDYNISPGQEKIISHSVPNSQLFGSENFETPPAGEPDEVHLWLFGGHTHQWGTDYDAWLKNADGSLGEQIYEGFYDLDYQINQGYYDYEEPAMRLFEPLLTFDRGLGIYSEASYLNGGNSTVQFGLTTDDEMQGFFVQYVVGDISGLPEPEPEPTGINDAIDAKLFDVYPNPNSGLVQVRLQDPSQAARINVYNAFGSSVKFESLNNSILDLSALPNGMYIIEVQQGAAVHKRKVVKQ